MARRADVNVVDITAAHWSGAGTNYIVQTVSGVLYMVYLDSLSDVAFKKSLDGGLTWSQSTLAATAGTTCRLAVWYDRWSGLNSDYICFAFDDSGTDDLSFRTIDTASSDALSTQVAIKADYTSLVTGGGHISITRAVSGNVYVKHVGDAGAEGDFFRLTQANFPNGAWDNRAIDEAVATLDQMILVPDFAAADTSDIMAIFWDASANEVSRKLYDDSGDSWGETLIANTMAELSTATAFASFDIAVDLTNSLIVLVAWSATDASNADLRCWTITSAAISEKTNVVLNSTDDQGLAAVTIDATTGYWSVFYCGASDGSETWNTAVNVYRKVSKDAGATWGPESKVNVGATALIRWLKTTNWQYRGRSVVAWVVDAQTDDLKISVDVTEPRAVYQLGV